MRLAASAARFYICKIMSYTRKSSPNAKPWFEGKHKFEHWYRDNQIYFITARCKDKIKAFAEEEAKQVVWERCDHYRQEFEFIPWIMTLMDNHYHWLGYNRYGENLPKMMQRIHGSVAKLVNDTLDVRLTPFWIDKGNQNYFDGSFATKSNAGVRFDISCTKV